jgi:hypothetical protein
VFDTRGSSANLVQKKYYRYGGGEVTMCLYVDDILVFGTNLNVLEEVFWTLSLRDNRRLRVAGRASILTI